MGDLPLRVVFLAEVIEQAEAGHRLVVGMHLPDSRPFLVGLSKIIVSDDHLNGVIVSSQPVLIAELLVEGVQTEHCLANVLCLVVNLLESILDLFSLIEQTIKLLEHFPNLLDDAEPAVYPFDIGQGNYFLVGADRYEAAAIKLPLDVPY